MILKLTGFLLLKAIFSCLVFSGQFGYLMVFEGQYSKYVFSTTSYVHLLICQHVCGLKKSICMFLTITRNDIFTKTIVDLEKERVQNERKVVVGLGTIQV